MDKNNVLVIGAGPTGMTLAIKLRQYNIPVTIIDKSKENRGGSKALTINPLSLLILKDLGVADSIIDRGHITRKMNVYYNNKRMSSINMDMIDTLFPFYVMLPQPETEKILSNHLEDHNWKINYRTELIDLVEHENYVTAYTKDKSGNISPKNYRYVVGCDGSRSSTREILNSHFKGHDYDMHFILADLKIEWNNSLNEGHYFIREEGFIIILPLGNGYHRIVSMKKGNMPDEKNISIDSINALVKRYRIGNLSASNMIWSSTSPLNNRLSDTFSSNNIFLAGDSCHSFSPLGGFGMNTGFGDAYNIAWKIYYSIAGICKNNILESYDVERRSIAKNLIKQTDLTTSLAGRLESHDKNIENNWFPKMSNRAFMRELALKSSGITQSYSEQIHNKPENKIQVNSILPFSLELIKITNKTTFGKHILILFLNQKKINDLRVKHLLESTNFSFIRKIIICNDNYIKTLNEIEIIVDNRETIVNKYSIDYGRIILVRPDMYIEKIVTLSEVESILIPYIKNNYTTH